MPHSCGSLQPLRKPVEIPQGVSRCQVRLCYVRGLGPQNHAAFAVCDLQGAGAQGLPPMVERQDAWRGSYLESKHCAVCICWFMSIGGGGIDISDILDLLQVSRSTLDHLEANM